MEQKYHPEATMHGYKTNRMKNNKRIRHSRRILMFAKTTQCLSKPWGGNQYKTRPPRDKQLNILRVRRE